MKKKTNDWLEKQNNQLTNRITWYWFKEPQTPTSISQKIYPKYANKMKRNKQGHIKPFVSKYVSGNEENPDKVGYKDYTPSRYFDSMPKDKNIKYDKDKEYLNLNFLFDYLKSKMEIMDYEKEILKELFNNWEIRKFLFEWNKVKNEKVSYNLCDKTEVYDFERDLIQAILTFYRCIFEYDEEFMLYFIFNRELVLEYFKMKDLIQDFVFPKSDLERNKRMILKNKIDSLYDTVPILHKKEQVIPLNTNNKKELVIIDYIKNFQKK